MNFFYHTGTTVPKLWWGGGKKKKGYWQLVQSYFDLPTPAVLAPKYRARNHCASMPATNDGNTTDSRVNTPPNPPVLSGKENATAHNAANMSAPWSSKDLKLQQKLLVSFLLFFTVDGLL